MVSSSSKSSVRCSPRCTVRRFLCSITRERQAFLSLAYASRLSRLSRLITELVQRLLEAVGVAPLGLRQRLEPVGDLAEAFVARLLGHARIHVGVLVRLAGDGRLQVGRGLADRQPRGGVADGLEVLEV